MSADPATDCANRLRALAADPRFAPRAEDLKSLADELEDDQLDSWVGVELVPAFPLSASLDLPPTDRGERNFAALVGASVFLPVAWTWFSLHKASAAYHSLIDDGRPVRETFINLWVTGFDGRLAGIHRLVPVSLISFVLIMVAALLVVIQRVASTSADHREAAAIRLAGASLVRELCTAQRILNGRRSDDPTRIEAVVKRSVKELLAANTATQDAARELREASGAVNQTLTTLTAAANDSRAAAAATAGAAQQLAGTSTAANEAIDDALRRFVTKSGAAVHDAGVLISDAVREVDGTQHKLGQKLDDLARAAREGGDSIGTAIERLEPGILRIDGSLTQHETAMQAQAHELTATRDAAERLLDRLMRSQGSNGSRRA
jgi:methyl-accepting chemotaxis protein